MLGIYGNIGYGKNLLMVEFAKWFNDQKIPVKSNFHINLPNCAFITIDQFLELEADNNNRTLVLIDEPYAWGMDSRRSTTNIDVAMSRKGLQSRKSGIDIIYATQLPSSIDKRFRFLSRSIFLALPPDPFGYHYLYMGKQYKMIHINMDEAQQLYKLYDTLEHIEPTFSEGYGEEDETMTEAVKYQGKKRGVSSYE
jgi:hypothetical protein